MTASVELRGLVVEHAGGVRALDGIDLAVEAGELMTIVGPSGCGKSTLLRAIAGLVQPSAGTISIDGRDVGPREPSERDVAFVFQSYALYPHMTVRRNLEFPLRMQKVSRRERVERAVETAERLGIESLLDRRPAELSGGQMQRVALGRALVRRPRVFLLDEPLSNLDPRLRDDVRAELRRLHAELGVTTLHVTHDQGEAMTLGQRVCVLGAGRVHQVGPPLEVHARPASRFVADLFGSPPMNLLEGEITAGRFVSGAVRIAAPGWLAPGPVVLGIRPEELGPGQDLVGVVEDVERTGDRTVVRVGARPGAVLAVLSGNAAASVGEEVSFGLCAEVCHWFAVGPGGERRSPRA